jgi:hypothetical protein
VTQKRIIVSKEKKSMADLVVALAGFSQESVFLGIVGTLKIADLYTDLAFAFHLGEYSDFFNTSFLHNSTTEVGVPSSLSDSGSDGISSSSSSSSDSSDDYYYTITIDSSTSGHVASYAVNKYFICALFFAGIGFLFDALKLYSFVRHTTSQWNELSKTSSWLGGKRLGFLEKIRALRTEEKHHYKDDKWWPSLNLLLESLPQVAIALVFGLEDAVYCDDVQTNHCTKDQVQFARGVWLSANVSLLFALLSSMMEVARLCRRRRRRRQQKIMNEHNTKNARWLLPIIATWPCPSRT